MDNAKLRTWVEVSESAVWHNVQAYKKILPKGIGIMAVIKSNAYGHGLTQMAALLREQVQHFSVVFIEEALALRAAGIKQPILVFSTVTFDEALVAEAIRQEVSFTIYDQESYGRISRVAEKIKKPALVHINVDTGMSRLGFSDYDQGHFAEYIYKNKFLDLQGVYTHLSSADSDPAFTHRQCERFKKLLIDKKDIYHTILYQHVLNTPAVMLGIDIGNMARLGLGLFGLSPGDTALEAVRQLDADFSLQPALSFKTRVIQVRKIPTGTSVGYGRTYQADRPIIEAVIPVGFADGYQRALSNQGEMLVRGVRCPILGRICMNNIMLDVTKVACATVGDEVVIIGHSGNERIAAKDIAKTLATNVTEVVTAIPAHLPRIYTKAKISF